MATAKQSGSSGQCLRIQVEMEVTGPEKSVKIRLENHDRNLGWYTSASLSLPLHQIPLLEQALARMRSQPRPGGPSTGTIVSFPGLK